MPTIALDKIRTDGGTQMRAEISKDVVREYVDKMESGETFPPIIVFDDGSDLWLADGFHRYEASVYRGDERIDADVKQGGKRDAILYAVGANGSHGLPRTNADKRRAVAILLEDAEWQQWPQTRIAAACGVTQPFVSKLLSSGEYASYNSYKIRTVERDGTSFEMSTENIGRKPASEKTILDGDTGAIIENAMVETVTLKPFKKPQDEDDSSDTGIGVVFRNDEKPAVRPDKPLSPVAAEAAALVILLEKPPTQWVYREIREAAKRIASLAAAN